MCDAICNTTENEYDGGDCIEQEPLICTKKMIGNFKCDKICNTTEFAFDGGDCKFEPIEVVTCKNE